MSSKTEIFNYLNFSVIIAQELKSWLLYYSLPVISGVLPRKYVSHHQSLVEAMHILLKDSISSRELKLAQRHLCFYVFMFGQIYGKFIFNSNYYSEFMV